jgi:hypothetical protein
MTVVIEHRISFPLFYAMLILTRRLLDVLTPTAEAKSDRARGSSTIRLRRIHHAFDFTQNLHRRSIPFRSRRRARAIMDACA